MDPQRASLLSDAFRVPLLFLGGVSGIVWVFTAVDDILYHTPYYWNQWCGEAGLSAIARYGCRAVYGYYFSLDAHVVDSGVVAATFLIVSSICITLLWLPKTGLFRAVLRTWLMLVPLQVFIFEAGVYFLANYWWTIHATQFLMGTPFSNEAVFWGAAALFATGVSVEAALRRSQATVRVTVR